MTGDLIQAVKNSLKPLVSDNMSDDMLDAWLTDLAQAAIAAIQADADLEQIKRERDQAVEALREAERAIAEYYRYWTGGETRGSYDGKPERNGLWKAKHKARQTLASIEGAGHE